MKKEEFIVGEWYKNLQDGWIGKFQGYKTDQWWGSEWFDENNNYDDKEGWISLTEDACLCPISEIIHLLPDNHPDKLKN